jgi:ATPase subunit of ABC transporter with duplicated ATPase domains
MLTVAGVTKAYGGRTLFEEVTTTFDAGHRYGLTGANGAGKSTFMKILAGELEPDIGEVVTPPQSRLSMLHQDHYRYEDDKVRDVVIMGNARLWAAMKEKDELLAAGDEMNDEVGMKLADLEVAIAEEDGYNAESEAEQLLVGLGIPVEAHEQPLRTLQGGMRLRVLLAQALFGTPQILLLDEPTNHLDLDSIQWLVEFLRSYTGVLVVISHDRHFLNEVCTDTADVDYENIILYPGAYDQMLRQKVEYRIAAEKGNAARRRRSRAARISSEVRRQRQEGGQATSRRKQITKIDLGGSQAQQHPAPVHPLRGGQGPSGKLVVERRQGVASRSTKPGAQGRVFTLTRGEKLAVVGRQRHRQDHATEA